VSQERPGAGMLRCSSRTQQLYHLRMVGAPQSSRNAPRQVHRTKLWFAFSGAHRMRKAAPEGKGYANLLQASASATLFSFKKVHSSNPPQAALDPGANNEANIEQIDKDLWRTGLPAFKKDQGEAAEQMVQKLRRVLLAYRSANAAISSSVSNDANSHFALAPLTFAPQRVRPRSWLLPGHELHRGVPQPPLLFIPVPAFPP
jgi:hypothetical protein